MNTLQDVWSVVLEALSKKLTQTAMSTWFDECQPVDLDGARLVIMAPTDFKRNVIITQFRDMITSTLSEIFSKDFGITVLIPDELTEYQEKKPTDDPFPEMAGYTFDRFIVGNSNRFAFNAAYSVAQNPGVSYNPLFIYGNSGLGKTHLLFAIGQAIRERDPGTKIAYVKSDDFTNQLIKAIKEGKGEEFRMKYRNVDLFLIDDIQFIAGKQATQEEFFHTFNNIYEAGHQIVITSDRPPIEMSTLEDRLASRFQGGLMADIQPPDLETRMAITKTKAAQRGLILESDIIAYVAEIITTNVRTIEGLINRLTAYRDIIDCRIDRAAVDMALKDLVRMGTFIPTPQQIIRECAIYYSLTEEDLRGQNRSKNTAIARQIAMYLIRTLTNMSLKDIGTEFEDRNHSTVLSSIKKIEDMIKTDNLMAATVRDITSNINSN